jgi:hypothetical protein
MARGRDAAGVMATDGDGLVWHAGVALGARQTSVSFAATSHWWRRDERGLDWSVHGGVAGAVEDDAWQCYSRRCL